MYVDVGVGGKVRRGVATESVRAPAIAVRDVIFSLQTAQPTERIDVILHQNVHV
jgi:hypothetical protein